MATKIDISAAISVETAVDLPSEAPSPLLVRLGDLTVDEAVARRRRGGKQSDGDAGAGAPVPTPAPTTVFRLALLATPAPDARALGDRLDAIAGSGGSPFWFQARVRDHARLMHTRLRRLCVPLPLSSGVGRRRYVRLGPQWVEEIWFWADSAAARALVWECVHRVLRVPLLRWCMVPALDPSAGVVVPGAVRGHDMIWRAPFAAAVGLRRLLQLLPPGAAAAETALPPTCAAPPTATGGGGSWVALLPEPVVVGEMERYQWYSDAAVRSWGVAADPEAGAVEQRSAPIVGPFLAFVAPPSPTDDEVVLPAGCHNVPRDAGALAALLGALHGGRPAEDFPVDAEALAALHADRADAVRVGLRLNFGVCVPYAQLQCGYGTCGGSGHSQSTADHQQHWPCHAAELCGESRRAVVRAVLLGREVKLEEEEEE